MEYTNYVTYLFVKLHRHKLDWEREELNVYRWQKWVGIHICMRNTWGFQKKAAIYCTDK